MSRRYGWLLLIFLAAAFLRIAWLTDAPPGLTHDEADHGLDAWGVVSGIRPIYFSVGYGREPLYDYATAVLMSFLGPSFLAGRLTSAYFSLILIAASFAWIRRAFDDRTALLAAAGLAVSFWAVMTGRQALRSITLPAIFALSAAFFWNAIERSGRVRNTQNAFSLARLWSSPYFSYSFAGLLLGLTFYTYIPARFTWLIFPIFLVFLALSYRSWFKEIWRGTVLLLLIALIIAVPLFAFLAANPDAESRLDQLSEPVTDALAGDLDLLAENIISGLGILSFKGDGQWRYNISGRPILTVIMSILFYTGLAVAIWLIVIGLRERRFRTRTGAAFFSLTWLALGLVPVMITGAELSTTRAIALQPVLYLFPALTLVAVAEAGQIGKRIAAGLAILLFAVLFVQTSLQYFKIWKNEPEVRVQYESSLVTTLNYLKESDRRATAISTTTPEQFHSPAVAFLKLGEQGNQIRWFNGKHALVVPNDTSSRLIFSGFAPLDTFLEPYFPGSFDHLLPSNPDDIDQPLTVFTAGLQSFQALSSEMFANSYHLPDEDGLSIQFGSVADLIGYDIQTPQARQGDEVRIATLWRAKKPLEDAILFTQLLGTGGLPVAQADRLDFPSRYWQAGDYFVQLHRFEIPDNLEPGSYPLIVGIYTREDLTRLEATVEGKAVGDHVQLPPLTIVNNG